MDGNYRVCTTYNTSKLFTITKTLSMDLATTSFLLIELLNTKVESNHNQKKEKEKETTFMRLNFSFLTDKNCKEACKLLLEVLKQLSLLIEKYPNQIFEFLMICRQELSQRFTGILLKVAFPKDSTRY